MDGLDHRIQAFAKSIVPLGIKPVCDFGSLVDETTANATVDLFVSEQESHGSWSCTGSGKALNLMT